MNNDKKGLLKSKTNTAFDAFYKYLEKSIKELEKAKECFSPQYFDISGLSRTPLDMVNECLSDVVDLKYHLGNNRKAIHSMIDSNRTS